VSGLRVLALDTSTEACSAALLWSDGQLSQRFTLTERSHADLILPMIDALLAEAGCRLTDLDGLAFGRGPGGFTGLRIAAGVVQGLAFGAGLPVAPVSSLAAVAYQAQPGQGVLVCNDARMNEVYWGCYRFDPALSAVPVALSDERVGPAEGVAPPGDVRAAAGNALGRFPGLRERLAAAGLQFHEGLYPTAAAVARIGDEVLRLGHGIRAAEAQPVYVRDNVATIPGPRVTRMS
jgi:tRNA threonylcarbamoyladenosine biosynthesis protein TsaB